MPQEQDLDEDVFKSLAPALRTRGFDAVSVHDLGHYGWADEEHLAYAADEGRAVFSFNAPDFIALHTLYHQEGRPHAGIVLSKQRAFRETLHLLLGLLNRVTAGEMKNQLWWI